MTPQPKRANRPALVLAAALLLPMALASTAVLAKTSDRNQQVLLNSDAMDGSPGNDGVTVFTGTVTLNQGSLAITAARAELTQANGVQTRAVFTGSQATMKQQMDDGTWMDAKANRVDYDMANDIVTLTGNYSLKSDRGTNAGEKMVYNLKSGTVQSGGDGTRVRTVINPKAATPGAAAPATGTTPAAATPVTPIPAKPAAKPAAKPTAKPAGTP